MSVPRSVDRLLAMARSGRLYPALILHGASESARRAAAEEIARCLLCERPAERRPCGECRHCLRIALPAGQHKDGEVRFHPDFAVLLRDAKTVTSAEATRELMRAAHSTPFEARGQVFVVAEAETLSAEAGDALLKLLEEPGLGSPRHFLLLAPSRLDLPATLRSRSLAVFLGAAETPPAGEVEPIAAAFGAAVTRFERRGSGLDLLDAAERLAASGEFTDPRARRPWVVAASAVRLAAFGRELAPGRRGALLALADDLLVEAPRLRLRGVPAARILEGLVSRRLTAAV